jgi:predicted DNA-binding ribbon-helix-helix protein
LGGVLRNNFNFQMTACEFNALQPAPMPPESRMAAYNNNLPLRLVIMPRSQRAIGFETGGIRSIVISPGYRTSVPLDVHFWEALQDIAKRRSLSVRELVAEIDCKRDGYPRTEAIRVYILRYYRRALSKAEATE